MTKVMHGNFTDLGHTVTNNYGVAVPVLTDIWGGDFSAHIPNPLKPMDEVPVEPDSFIMQVPPFAGPPVGLGPGPFPWVNPVCMLGCGPDIPPTIGPGTLEPVPEPATMLLMGVSLVLVACLRRVRP